MDNNQSNSKPIPSAREVEKPAETKVNHFTFEMNCDHNPEFNTIYKLIFKASAVYSDADGRGYSYPSTITGGLAGDGHNNVVTLTAEQTATAMSITNKTQGKKSDKQVNSLAKDFTSLN